MVVHTVPYENIAGQNICFVWHNITNVLNDCQILKRNIWKV